MSSSKAMYLPSLDHSVGPCTLPAQYFEQVIVRKRGEVEGVGWACGGSKHGK